MVYPNGKNRTINNCGLFYKKTINQTIKQKSNLPILIYMRRRWPHVAVSSVRKISYNAASSTVLASVSHGTIGCYFIITTHPESKNINSNYSPIHYFYTLIADSEMHHASMQSNYQLIRFVYKWVISDFFPAIA